MDPTSQSSLKVLFPLKVLRTDERLLDASNTDSTYEYYLLENLALGLIRDDVDDVRGYKPALASQWKQQDETTWVFTVKPQLKWSDGSAMTGRQIADHFERIKANPPRHHLYLKYLKTINWDDRSSELKFVFARPTNQALLHELSLADAAILHPTNLSKNWRITSGMYSVEQYDPQAGFLTLRINPYAAIPAEGAPQKIRLVGWKAFQDMQQAFKQTDIDLVRMPVLSFRKTLQIMESQAPKIYRGYPVMIYYFSFNEKHTLFNDVEARREFAFLVEQTFAGIKIGKDIVYENQMVPLGYSGRLPSYQSGRKTIKKLKGKTIYLNFHPAFEEVPNILEKFRNVAAQFNVNLQYHFTAFTADEKWQGEIAKMGIFSGNQRESLGSWMFLFSGDLKGFKNVAMPYLEKAVTARENQKEEILKNLHQEILDKAFCVPFLIETSKTLTAEHVNISKWNLFDMRMRFYDIRFQ